MEANYTRDLNVDKSISERRLDKMKKIESETKMYSKRINNKTIVFCKREERIADFEKSVNPVKINVNEL